MIRLASLGLVALLIGACGGNNVEATEDPGEIAFELEVQTPREATGVRATLSYKTRDKTRIVVDGLDESERRGWGESRLASERELR